MFVDIRGFTAMSEKYPPEVVFDILNQFFSVVQSAVGKYRGIIDKFLGDGALAIWGTTEREQEQTKLAVDAAYEIHRRMEELNLSLASNSLPRLEIGIGINTGHALVGNIGSEARMEFTAIGPTVNLASRLEGLCKVYNSRIVISDSVLKKLEIAELEKWEIKENVTIRGSEREVRIGVLKSFNSHTS
jgi:adenylate cyclase